MVGTTTNGFILKFIPESILTIPDFSVSTSWSMNILAQGVNDIVSISPISINSISSEGLGPFSFTSIPSYSFSYSSITISDVYYQSTYLSVTITELNTMVITPDLSCSQSGTTSISFSLASYDSSQVPSWLKLDSNTGKLIISAPSVSSDTKYYFYINANISGFSSPVQKLVWVTVINWTVNDCQRWASTNGAFWEKCNSDYDLNSGSWSASSRLNLAGILSIVTISWISSACLIVIVTTMMNTSSIASLWIIINQVQIFFLLFLTRAFIPNSVELVIVGFKFTLNPAGYIPFKRVKTYGSAIDNFNYELSNSLLEPLEINSDSTVFNTYSFFTTLALLIPVHLFVFILYSCWGRREVRNRWLWWKKVFKWIITKSFTILTFGYYIKSIIEMNQYFLVSSVYEIYNFNTSQTWRIISLIFALLLFLFLIIFVIWIAYLAFTTFLIIKSKHNKFGQLFEGFKSTEQI